MSHQSFHSHFQFTVTRFGKLAIALSATLPFAMPIGVSPVRAQSSEPIPIETPPGIPTSGTPSLSNQRFSCQFKDGQYIVMYQPKSQPDKYFPWAVPSAMGGGWSPERRCYEISRRLESYRPDGLVEMRTGVENSYNIVCATTDRNGACRIVFTVPQGQDPNSIRDRVFSNLTTADSGQQTSGVYTFAEGERNWLGKDLSNLLGGTLPNIGSLGSPASSPTVDRANSRSRGDGIYLKPFLDPSDGGTGTGLVGKLTSQGSRLNPGNFR